MYFVKGGNEVEYGPVPADTVKRWILEGRLTGSSLARTIDSEIWQPLSRHPEFAQALGPPVIAPAPVSPVAPAELAAQRQSKRTSGLAIASLILGIITPCTLGLTGLLGSALGIAALVAIRRRPQELQGRGLAITGICISAILLMVTLALALAIAIPNFKAARDTARRNACIHNLREIDRAKTQWALTNKKRTEATPGWEDLVGPNAYLAERPVCPAGGEYSIGDMNTEPTCSVPTHSLNFRETRHKRPPR